MHLHEVDIHEERLVILGMRFDVSNCRIGLPDIELMKIIVVNARDLLRRFASGAFPFI